jgi:hypothetical protein
MTERIFKQLTRTSEVSKFVVYLFKGKYERIDFDYFDMKDINKIFKQMSADKMNVNDRRKSSFKGEYELAKIEDIEYEVINYNKDKGNYLRTVMDGSNSSAGQINYNDSVLTNNVIHNLNETTMIDDDSENMFKAIDMRRTIKHHADTIVQSEHGRTSSMNTTNSSPGHS